MEVSPLWSVKSRHDTFDKRLAQYFCAFCLTWHQSLCSGPDREKDNNNDDDSNNYKNNNNDNNNDNDDNINNNENKNKAPGISSKLSSKTGSR